MLGYTTLGSNDRERANIFYDAVLGVIGAKRIFNNDRMIFWGTDFSQPMLGVGTPWDEGTAGSGNGTMVALAAGSRDMVEKIYAKALEMGGADEGAPGERGGNFYGGYFRDLDGNKIVAFHMG